MSQGGIKVGKQGKYRVGLEGNQLQGFIRGMCNLVYSKHSHGWSFVVQCERTAFTQILTLTDGLSFSEASRALSELSSILLLWENMKVTHLFRGLFLDNVNEH